MGRAEWAVVRRAPAAISLDLLSTSSQPPLDLLSASSRPPLDLLSASSRPPLGLLSTSSRPPLGLLSASSRPPLGLLSGAHRVGGDEEPADGDGLLVGESLGESGHPPGSRAEGVERGRGETALTGCAGTVRGLWAVAPSLAVARDHP